MIPIERKRGFVWCLAGVTWATVAHGMAAPQATITNSNVLTPSITSSSPAPTTTSFTPTFASHDRAQKCWASYYSYSSISNSIQDRWSYTTLGTFPTYVETTCCYPNVEAVSTTTLCDGFPRGVGFPRTVWNITSTETYYDYTLTSVVYPPHTEIRPTCSLDDEGDACTRLWSSWDVTYTSLKTASLERARQIWDDEGRPPCSSPLQACPTATECSIEANSVTMYYWPVTTASGGDFCEHNGTILTPTPTDDGGSPNTVESGDMTFTSPSVYIVAPSAYAWYAIRTRGYTTWGISCGTADPSFTYAVDPDSISTINPHTPEVNYPMDWQDLNTVRHEAYQRECPRRYGCSWFPSIVSDFTPYVRMPLEVHTARDQWEGCSGLGIFNPQLVRLGEDVTANLGDDDDRVLGLVGVQGGVKSSAPASNRNAKSTQTRHAGPDSTPKGDYHRKDFIEEIRVIVLDERAPADAEAV